MSRNFDPKVLAIATLVAVGFISSSSMSLAQEQDSQGRRGDTGAGPPETKKEHERKPDNLNQPRSSEGQADKLRSREDDRPTSEGLKQKQREDEPSHADVDKRKRPEEDRGSAGSLKQKQHQDEGGKAETEKRRRLEEDRSTADSQKQKQLEIERSKAEADKQKKREEDRTDAEALKRRQLEDSRSKGEADKQKKLEEDRTNAEVKQLEDERSKAEADKQKKLDDRRDADALKKQQEEDERTKASADWQKKLDQDKTKAETQKVPGEQPKPTESSAKPAQQVREHHEQEDKEFEKAKAQALKERGQGGGGSADEKRLDESEKKFEELRQQRHERVEDGGRRVVIEEPDNRKIVRENGQSFIRHDESDRFQRIYGDVHKERRGDVNVSIFVGSGGRQIFTDYDDEGRPLRRYRRDADGREFVFFDNRDYYRRARRDTFLDAVIFLPPPIVRIPRERYIVDYERASDDDIYDALSAPPVEHLERRYSLEEVRYSRDVRDRMPRVDLDTIHFDFGSWDVEPSQYPLLERVARIIGRIIERHPDEMFLIEGHTDAVGSDDDNLSLSDRRAQAVAEILTKEFQVPAENLSTQGYGEQFLKINTPGPERANRRVAIRRITPLLSRAEPRD